MKKLWICLLLVGILCLVGCEPDYLVDWEFDYGAEEIVAIQVVNIYKYIYDEEMGQNIPKYVVLKEIDLTLAQEFYNDFTQIKYFISPPNPEEVPKRRCFLVFFENGEYDIYSEDYIVRMRYDGNHILKAKEESLLCVQHTSNFQALLEKYYFN